ncbi:MAG: right-handed parallel beta-helix repeat-containing protein [Planctomycetota bacterium]
MVQAPAQGRDWFVRAGASAGDGTRGRPFADPWEPLGKCEASDRIHVAEGKYFGRMGTGVWVIPFDGVELIGGYDTEFNQRDPWQRPSHLLWAKDSQNWPKDVRVGSMAKGVVLDGFALDMKDQNEYVDEACSGRTTRSSESAISFTQPGTVRNCVVINPGFHGIVCPPGSSIENNLIVNAIVWGVSIYTNTGDFARMTATVKNNTILYCWDTNKPGGGGYGGSAIAARGPVTIANNILAYCDNNAIFLQQAPDRCAVTGNVFWRNRFSNFKCEHGSQGAIADDQAMELLEEVGLKAFAGNQIKAPEFTLDAAWLGLAKKRDEQKPAVEEKKEPLRWGEQRPAEIPQGFAPAMDFTSALVLLAPKNAGVTAGARIVPLTVTLKEVVAAAPAKSYRKAEFTSWYEKPDQVNGHALEMTVARAGVANVSSMPSLYDQKKIEGVFLQDPQGTGERLTGFYLKGSNVQRVCNDLAGAYSGSGKPDKLYVVRGIAHAVQGVPKAAFFIESIEDYEPPVAAGKQRPAGRDWFVRAGAAGGDGSREKPFRDPFQALERCESGDTIHVTEGEYVGKLKAGTWSVDTAHIALLGGYDQAFAERNPWTHPTRLVCPADFKGQRGGYTLQGDGDHTGTIVDGFVFDKRFNNRYEQAGGLDTTRSDKTEHVWLARSECVIRNCTFLNGALGAVRVATGQLLENNIFVNHVTQTVDVQRGHTTAPTVIRNNTLLFAWAEKRPGTGQGALGNLLHLSTDVRAVVEGNVFAYADNDAIRMDGVPRDVALRGNVFSHNLWSNLQHMPNYSSFGDRNWQQLADLGLGQNEGNTLADPGIPIDASWLARHRAERGVPAAADKAADGKVNEPAPPSSNPFDNGGAIPPTTPPAAPPLAAGGNPFDAPSETKSAASSGGGIAPAYEWQRAVALFSPDGKTGARAANQPVAFTGIQRTQESHVYADSSWDASRSKAEWDKLDGKRVRLQLAIQRLDNQFQLPGVTAADHTAFMVEGPLGSEVALPLRCYVKKGTRTERVVNQAKNNPPGQPEEAYWISGVAHANRQMVVEVIARVE